jgi:hypothetical protein
MQLLKDPVQNRFKLGVNTPLNPVLNGLLQTIASAVGEFEAQSMRLEKKLAEQRAENTRVSR